jgi:hypothetical protein
MMCDSSKRTVGYPPILGHSRLGGACRKLPVGNRPKNGSFSDPMNCLESSHRTRLQLADVLMDELQVGAEQSQQYRSTRLRRQDCASTVEFLL